MSARYLWQRLWFPCVLIRCGGRLRCSQVLRYRRSGDNRWLLTILGSDEQLMTDIKARELEAAQLAAPVGTAIPSIGDKSFRGTSLSNESLDEFLVAGPDERPKDPLKGVWKEHAHSKTLMRQRPLFTGKGAGCSPSAGGVERLATRGRRSSPQPCGVRACARDVVWRFWIRV